MKKCLLLICCLLGWQLLPVEAQVWFEGYGIPAMQSDQAASMLLVKMRQQDPNATLQDAKLKLAERVALMDASRNRLEYIQGVNFTWQNKTLRLDTGGRLRSRCYTATIIKRRQILPSKIVLVRLLDKNVQRKLPAGKIREVSGQTPTKNQINLAMALRRARLDAYEKAIAQAVQEKFGDNPPETIKGKLYIHKTVKDCLTEDHYTITLQLIVVLLP